MSFQEHFYLNRLLKISGKHKNREKAKGEIQHLMRSINVNERFDVCFMIKVRTFNRQVCPKHVVSSRPLRVLPKITFPKIMYFSVIEIVLYPF